MEPEASPVAAPDHVHLEDTTPWVRRWLRAEGILAFAWGAVIWILLRQPLPLFLVALLVPDVSMLGYLRGPHSGAIVYNVVHNWATAGLVLLIALVAQSGPLLLVGAILLEQNDEWAVQRSRYMTLETMAPLSDDPTISLPVVGR